MESTPPRATAIDMENFIESATRAVLRAFEAAALNPQPLPPKQRGEGHDAAPLNPQPLPPFDVTVGIILSTDQLAVTRSASET